MPAVEIIIRDAVLTQTSHRCIVREPPVMKTVLTQTRHKCIVREPPIKNRTLCQMDVGRASSEDCLCATPNFITWLRYQRSLQGLAARTHCASLLQSSEPQAPQSSEQLCLQGLAARTHCASLAPAQSPASAPPPRPARVREESAGESAAHQLTVRAHQGLVQLVIALLAAARLSATRVAILSLGPAART